MNAEGCKPCYHNHGMKIVESRIAKFSRRMLIILTSLFGKWLKVRILYMSYNGIWRLIEALDGFKPIAAMGV